MAKTSDVHWALSISTRSPRWQLHFSIKRRPASNSVGVGNALWGCASSPPIRSSMKGMAKKCAVPQLHCCWQYPAGQSIRANSRGQAQ